MLVHHRLGEVNVVNNLATALDRSKENEHEKDGRLQYARFASFDLLHTYVPNRGWSSESCQKRRDWDNALIRFLKRRAELTTRPLVWCGDLNCAHRPEDSTDEVFFRSEWDAKKKEYNGNRAKYEAVTPLEERGIPGFADSERQRFDALLAAGGLVDVWRRLNPVDPDAAPPDPEEARWTWRGAGSLSNAYHARYEGMAQRLDYFLVPGAMMATRVRSCEILGRGQDRRPDQGFFGSDHCPVQLVLGSAEGEGEEQQEGTAQQAQEAREEENEEEETCNDDVSTDEWPVGA